MTTLADLKSAIATDLRRDDLTSDIAAKISEAISYYQNELFWFNYTRTFTFTTVASQQDYSSSDLVQIPLFTKIMAMFLYSPPSVYPYPLDRFEPADFETLASNNLSGGRPTIFTYIDNKIRLWPIPLATYTVRVHGVYNAAALVNGSDSNFWTVEAEPLIRCYAKYLLYMNVLEDTEGAARMKTQLPDIIGSLRAETSMRLTDGKLQATEW